MMSETAEPLTEALVSEIEARHELAEAAFAPYQAVSDSLDDIPALIRDWRAMKASWDLAYTNAPHTEEEGEVCTDDCQGCLNPVAALVTDRNEARALGFERGKEIAAMREQLAEKDREIEALNKLTDRHLKPEIHDAMERLK